MRQTQTVAVGGLRPSLAKHANGGEISRPWAIGLRADNNGWRGPDDICWNHEEQSMHTRIPALALAVGLLSNMLAADENWPQFRGPRANGQSDSTGLPLTWSETENIVWKTPIHGRGWSSPVIWGEQIWLGTATEDGKDMSAVCIDQRTGAILHDITLFHNEEPAFCHAMNSYASPTPAIEEGRVYMHFGSYGTACLDTKTAVVLWSRRDLPCDHFRGPASSPILFEDRLFVHFDGFDYQYVVALEKATGKTIWKVDRDVAYGSENGDFKKAYCTPVLVEIDGRPQLISPTSKAAIAYDPRDGKELWRIRYPGFSATAMPLVGHGMLFINTGFSKAELYAVRMGGSGDVTDTHVAWIEKRGVPSKPSQLLIDDLIYMIDDKGIASCLEAKTGELVWTHRLGGEFSASPLYADGRIYMFSHDGPTTVIEPGREYKALASNPLDAGCMASPAVSGKALFVRTKTHMYRLEKSAGN
jgi:outer membrane protein assembly factor BamB